MQKIEYYTEISEKGQIFLPDDIRKRIPVKPDQKIRVILEIPHFQEDKKKAYSFEKVRKLLNGIKGDMSSEILADRTDRV